ncbi:MFS transporter [Duganella sp. BJB488]|uniref:MFS transporter n=1 Tax=unclassified Duganella TaxID=2636909 RepID=UPI000E3429A6|nr:MULTISPECIES: MFS transporter [unclassified Duganella]RFP26115.1 MFS transporter [Duganella sp. BJB489]RFP28146.1 MFS transporter [Duganella sp. BJB488]RFP37043.1 MFS transporter [Duganella sp. BJB480]
MDVYAPQVWLPHERPSLPGSPSTPLHTAERRLAFLVVGFIVAVTGGLGNALVSVNLPYLQGSLGVYSAEIQWLPAAYVMANVSMNLLLVKFRQQYGLRLFTELFLVVYALATVAHLFVHGLASAIAVRAAHGMSGAALTTLGLYYTLQAFPAQHRLKAAVFGIGFSQLALPMARLFSSELMEFGEWRGLYFFELGLALLSLACVLALKLPPGDRVKAFEKMDFLTFGLFAPGVALLSAVLALGRTVWWFESRWLGLCLAGAIVLIAAALLVEHNRARPLLNTRWLSNGNIARLALSVLLIRVVQSEANGTVGFLQALGLNNDQMQTLWIVVMVGTVAGLVASALTITPPRIPLQLMFSLVLMAVGAYMDSDATNLTRPADLYVSQFLLAFGGAFFIGPTFISGFGAVIAAPNNLVSFSVMFSITQTLGSLLGSALVGTFQVVREKFHSSILVEHLTLLDPMVAARIQSGGASVGAGLADPAARGATGVAALGAAATREANILAYNDVFLMITLVALLTLAWMLGRYLWSVCVVCPGSPAHNAQTGMANVSLNNSGSR